MREFSLLSCACLPLTAASCAVVRRVFWLGPLAGAVVAAILNEVAFQARFLALSGLPPRRVSSLSLLPASRKHINRSAAARTVVSSLAEEARFGNLSSMPLTTE